MRKIAPPGIYEYVIARTKLMDEAFADALENDFPQIVILGAGMDTRALRFKDANKGTKIFELDVRNTQEPKVKILNKKGIALPEELVYVAINFNKQSLSSALLGAGFETERKTLFLWEGVTMYLTAEAVDGTLSFIHENSSEGSIVIFDYIYAAMLRRENRYYGEKGIYERVSKAGEGYTFGLEEGEIEGFLADRGFSLISHHTPQDLEKAYFTVEGEAVKRRINGTHCVAKARKGQGVKG